MVKRSGGGGGADDDDDDDLNAAADEASSNDDEVDDIAELKIPAGADGDGDGDGEEQAAGVDDNNDDNEDNAFNGRADALAPPPPGIAPPPRGIALCLTEEGSEEVLPGAAEVDEISNDAVGTEAAAVPQQEGAEDADMEEAQELEVKRGAETDSPAPEAASIENVMGLTENDDDDNQNDDKDMNEAEGDDDNDVRK